MIVPAQPDRDRIRKTSTDVQVGKPTLVELQTKLDGVRREVRNLTVDGDGSKAATKAGSTHQGIGAVSPR
jgi:hypothetical protein